jgi:hypothetical protein
MGRENVVEHAVAVHEVVIRGDPLSVDDLEP